MSSGFESRSEVRVHIVIVVGARPNFMKAAPIIAAIKQHNQRIDSDTAERSRWFPGPIRYTLVHTGQHYDDLMSGTFFRDLGLPEPDMFLGVGSGSHADQTAQIMTAFEPVLLARRPHVVMLVGDVNSTVACALVTAKIAFDSEGARPLIAHVEAGLRSFDRSMPEEVNRIVTDHLSDLLFVTEKSAIQNLRNEGIPASKIHFAGNTMIDSLVAFKEKAETSTILDRLNLRTHAPGGEETKTILPYALLTLHRPSNVDNPERFLGILKGLEDLAATRPVIFPTHPRTRRRVEEFGVLPDLGVRATPMNPDVAVSGSPQRGIVLTDPLGYLDFLCLMKHATIVITDSGGVQEETTCLGVPCVTARDNTERPVTTEIGTNFIAGTDSDRIKGALWRNIVPRKARRALPEKWDGRAAARIVAVLSSIGQESNRQADAVTAHRGD